MGAARGDDDAAAAEAAADGGTGSGGEAGAAARVTRGVWGGHITSSPAGINYGDGVSETQSTAEFPVGTTVSLSVTPQQLATEAYDVEWSGDCVGDSQGSSVTISKDKECRVELKRILP